MDAVVLAAGLGERLANVVDDRPKGFVQVGESTLAELLIETLLTNSAVDRLTLVTGHMADHYGRLAEKWDRVSTAHNPQYATTGTLSSLSIGALALGIDDDQEILVVNGDILFEPLAIDALVAGDASDTLLISGLADRGDEAFVGGTPDGRVTAVSKSIARVGQPIGEFIGLSRLSGTALREMRRVGLDDRAGYEVALDAISGTYPLHYTSVGGLVWGEVDDADQLARLRADVYPRIVAR